MKKAFYILAICMIGLVSSISSWGQSNQEEMEPLVDWDERYSEKYIGIGIMGLIKHPGLEFNYSFPHKFFVKEKKKKGDEVRINKSRRWDVFARYYYHRNFHHNVVLTGGRTWQRSLKNDRFFISQADVGIARTFYTNPTFQVDNGTVKRVYFDGDFYASFNYRFGLGKHLKRGNDVYRVYTYFGVMNFAPYNGLYYSRLVIGLNLNKFLVKK